MSHTGPSPASFHLISFHFRSLPPCPTRPDVQLTTYPRRAGCELFLHSHSAEQLGWGERGQIRRRIVTPLATLWSSHCGWRFDEFLNGRIAGYLSGRRMRCRIGRERRSSLSRGRGSSSAEPGPGGRGLTQRNTQGGLTFDTPHCASVPEVIQVEYRWFRGTGGSEVGNTGGDCTERREKDVSYDTRDETRHWCVWLHAELPMRN